MYMAVYKGRLCQFRWEEMCQFEAPQRSFSGTQQLLKSGLQVNLSREYYLLFIRLRYIGIAMN